MVATTSTERHASGGFFFLLANCPCHLRIASAEPELLTVAWHEIVIPMLVELLQRASKPFDADRLAKSVTPDLHTFPRPARIGEYRLIGHDTLPSAGHECEVYGLYG